MPKMVLDHAGSSDMIQSKEARHTVTANTGRNATDSRTFRSVWIASPSASWRRELRTMAAAKSIHTTRYTAARATKNMGDSHSALNACAPSAAPGSPAHHGYTVGWRTKTAARPKAATGRTNAIASGTLRKTTLHEAPHAYCRAIKKIPPNPTPAR